MDIHLFLQLYDYTLTFEYEVKYMWRSKCSLVKVLFFIVRYSPFADTSLVLYRAYVALSVSGPNLSHLKQISLGSVYRL